MGWICVTDACEGHIVDGVWDKTGIAYFSIADEIKIIHDGFFAYISNIGGTAFMFAMLILVLTLVIALIVSARLYVSRNIGN